MSPPRVTYLEFLSVNEEFLFEKSFYSISLAAPYVTVHQMYNMFIGSFLYVTLFM